MESSMTITRPSTRRPLATMSKLTVGALVGVAGVLSYAQLVFGGTDPMVIGVSVLALFLAGIVAVGWRWAPLLGTLAFGFLTFMAVMGGSEIRFILSHPGDFRPFSLVVLALPVLAVGLIASVWATVQNYRNTEHPAIRSVPIVLVALAGMIGGALLVASVAGSGTGAGVSPEILASLPAVTLDDFEGGTIRVKAGETVALRLENAHPVPHQFDVDELGVHAPMPGDKQSLALFKATTPGTYLFYCAPHYNKATGEGMRGTLIVE